jgi:hypothetical protein
MNFIGGSGAEWWKLSRRLNDALDRVSDPLRDRSAHSLSLGSPVLVGQRSGDLIRVPIILRGGTREGPVAYLHVTKVQTDKKRIDAIAEKAAEIAQAALANDGSASGQEVIITY